MTNDKLTRSSRPRSRLPRSPSPRRPLQVRRCFVIPFEIGTARSLPWDGRLAGRTGKADYKIENLISETEALLTPSTPVLVRMETLRRAALYASTNATGRERAARPATCARGSDPKQADDPDALAFLDAAYVAEAFREIASLSRRGVRRTRAEGVACHAWQRGWLCVDQPKYFGTSRRSRHSVCRRADCRRQESLLTIPIMRQRRAPARPGIRSSHGTSTTCSSATEARNNTD